MRWLPTCQEQSERWRRRQVCAPFAPRRSARVIPLGVHDQTRSIPFLPALCDQRSIRLVLVSRASWGVRTDRPTVSCRGSRAAGMRISQPCGQTPSVPAGGAWKSQRRARSLRAISKIQRSARNRPLGCERCDRNRLTVYSSVSFAQAVAFTQLKRAGLERPSLRSVLSGPPACHQDHGVAEKLASSIGQPLRPRSQSWSPPRQPL